MHPDIEAFYVAAGYEIRKTTYPSLVTWDKAKDGKLRGTVAIKERDDSIRYLFSGEWHNE